MNVFLTVLLIQFLLVKKINLRPIDIPSFSIIVCKNHYAYFVIYLKFYIQLLTSHLFANLFFVKSFEFFRFKVQSFCSLYAKST